MNDTATLFDRFRPAFVSLGQASVQLAPAEAVGIPALRRSPQLNGRLVSTLHAIQRFADDSRTLPGLALLTETAQLIAPTIAYLEPAQTSCNYLALFFRNLEGALSESDVIGSMLERARRSRCPQLPGSEAGPASAPANGPPLSALKGLTPGQRTLVDDSFLHSDPYPATACAWPGGGRAAGNERYVPGPSRSARRRLSSPGPSEPSGCCHEVGGARHLTGESEPRSGDPAAGRRLVLHLHQAAALHAPLHDQGRREQLQPARPGLAGANRRRDGRQGQLDRPLPETAICPW